jgi:divalent metal cation (Fe/Co/Zn/Cd) transporter
MLVASSTEVCRINSRISWHPSRDVANHSNSQSLRCVHIRSYKSLLSIFVSLLCCAQILLGFHCLSRLLVLFVHFFIVWSGNMAGNIG